MQENYGTSLIDHAGTGEWDKRIRERTLGHDGDFVHGMFQEPVINCDGNFNQGHEFPHFATNGTIPPAWLRSMLWLGAVTANMVNQLVFVLGPATPFELTDVMSAWAAEELELMPSLYGTFGQRDSVLATVASATPAVTFDALRARAWSENAGCVHLVVVNANTSTAARFTLQLTGSLDGLKAVSAAQRLFEARYTVPVSSSDGARHLADWVGPAQTNVYRLGTNCSEGVEFSNTPASKTDDRAQTAVPRWVNSSRNVHKFLVWDDPGYAHDPANASFYRAQIKENAQHIDFIWGARPEWVPLWRAANPEIIVSAYRPFTRDYEDCVHRDTPTGARPRRNGSILSWWEHEHPEWIVYKCSEDGGPSKTPAWSFSDETCVPLDISNPGVIKFQLENCTAQAAAQGFTAIAWDNMGWAVSGDTSGDPSSCTGVWRGGKWVRLEGGYPAEKDVRHWLEAVHEGVHKQGMLSIPNWSTYGASWGGSVSGPLNDSATGWNGSMAMFLANHSDGLLSEAAFVEMRDACGRLPPFNNLSACEWDETAFENDLLWVQNLQVRPRQILNWRAEFARLAIVVHVH